MSAGKNIENLVHALEAMASPTAQGEPNDKNAFLYTLIHKIREYAALQLAEYGGILGTRRVMDDRHKVSDTLMECFDWTRMVGDESHRVANIYHYLRQTEDGAAPEVVHGLTTTERLQNEKTIIGKLWQLAMNAGMDKIVRVNDGEEWSDADNFDAAWSTISAVDESSLKFTLDNEDYYVDIILDNGNNGFHVISDHTVDVEGSIWDTIITKFTEWDEQREEKFRTTGMLAVTD